MVCVDQDDVNDVGIYVREWVLGVGCDDVDDGSYGDDLYGWVRASE